MFPKKFFFSATFLILSLILADVHGQYGGGDAAKAHSGGKSEKRDQGKYPEDCKTLAVSPHF